MSLTRFLLSRDGYISLAPTTMNRGGRDVPNPDETKGRVKEAAGDLTDDNELKREGQADQATGKAKDAIDNAADKAKDAIDRD
jgi:uncharacterized protein YjbJ (UPF0337 family)